MEEVAGLELSEANTWRDTAKRYTARKSSPLEESIWCALSNIRPRYRFINLTFQTSTAIV